MPGGLCHNTRFHLPAVNEVPMPRLNFILDDGPVDRLACRSAQSWPDGGDCAGQLAPRVAS